MPSREWRELERLVRVRPRGARLEAEQLDEVPEPARRYLLHAIAPGSELFRSVRLETRFRMKLRPTARSWTVLEGEELLAPPLGLVWRARARIGLLPCRVTDHYVAGEGGVRAKLLGWIPVVGADGPDVTRSARGRLAAETLWLPSTLMPTRDTTWERVDAERARVRLTLDGHRIPLTLRIDDEGRLRELSMLRYGDVGVDAWQPIPYGVEVLAERRFAGYTIPTRLRGGWWHGTDREEEFTSDFEVRSAEFE